VSITWTRVKVIPFNYFGCGMQGVTCLGSGRMLATLEEVGGPTGTVLRTFLSADNGQTWAEGTELDLADNLSQCRIRTMAFDTVVTGFSGPQTFPSVYESQGTVVARSTDAGATWASAVTLADWTAMFPNTATTDFWQTTDFVKLVDETTVLALGFFTSVGAANTYLTSTDGGVTFNNPRNVTGSFGHFGGVSMGGGVVILCDTSHNPARVFRSTDSGGSFAAVTLPGVGSGATNGAAAIGPVSGQRVGVVGGRSGQVAFFSTDNGVSWTQATIGGAAQNGLDMVAVDASHVVLGMTITLAQSAAGQTPFRLSTDGGATYPDSGIIDAGTPLDPAVGYAVFQLAVADDGSIIAVVQTTDGSNTHPNEIWRGVISGLVVDGPCVPLTPPVPPGPPVGVLTPRLDCVPIFSPVSCLVECPPDPAPAVGLLVAPSARGGGFLSPLFLLGLVTGTGGLLVTTGALGVSTTCGATFANNHCAVAGC
jgi:hypothetical protein